jgi:hypothetical protein
MKIRMNKWKEFIPDLQAMLEEDYSFGCDSSTWQGSWSI